MVLAAIPTDNTFTKEDVADEWQHIRYLWNQHLKASVGPLLCHASDGDSRRRHNFLQLFDADHRTGFTLDCKGFLYAAKYDGKYPVLADSDSIHNAKKLRNPFLNPTLNLTLGRCVATFRHMLKVRDKQHFSQEEHGLQACDVQVKDKQNWAAVQRLCRPKALSCLNGLKETTFDGTAAFLHVLQQHVDAFFSPTASLSQRVEKLWMVYTFFWMWRMCIHHKGKPYTLRGNFISREAYQDLALSIHGALLYIKAMRVFFSHLPCCLHLLGSDPCENVFGQARGLISHQVNFCFGDFLQNINVINDLLNLKCNRPDIKFPPNKRGATTWSEGKEYDMKVLSDYSDVQTDDLMVQAMQRGREQALALLKELDMKQTLEENGCWSGPFNLGADDQEGIDLLMR